MKRKKNDNKSETLNDYKNELKLYYEKGGV